MDQVTREITREYRLDFNNGEGHWCDRIPPEVTCNVLGRPATRIINRTSLLAWSLMMNLRDVAIADVTAEGWMKISITTGPKFDEAAFTREVAETLTAVTRVRSYGQPGSLPRHNERSRPGAWAIPEIGGAHDRRALGHSTA
jgi:hypothetical protein